MENRSNLKDIIAKQIELDEINDYVDHDRIYIQHTLRHQSISSENRSMKNLTG